MKPDISEFSFGFALTHELIAHYGLTSLAPEFPNLRQEGGLGYDVKLSGGGLPVFLQFKLSEYMNRSSALAAGNVGVPHYRAALRPTRHSKQHSLLLKLEAQGFPVFYAAPLFHTPSGLDDAFTQRNVVARTAFFRPQDIGPLPDDRDHSLSFRQSSTTAWLYSEPERLERYDGISLFREWIPRLKVEVLRGRRNDLTPSAVASMLVSLLMAEATTGRVWQPIADFVEQEGGPQSRALLLARFYFGAELLFA